VNGAGFPERGGGAAGWAQLGRVEAQIIWGPFLNSRQEQQQQPVLESVLERQIDVFWYTTPHPSPPVLRLLGSGHLFRPLATSSLVQYESRGPSPVPGTLA
jgi:hypothetical protein